LKEGKTRAQLLEAERARKLKRMVSAGLVREDKPLRNAGSMWTWYGTVVAMNDTSLIC